MGYAAAGGGGTARCSTTSTQCPAPRGPRAAAPCPSRAGVRRSRSAGSSRIAARRSRRGCWRARVERTLHSGSRAAALLARTREPGTQAAPPPPQSPARLPSSPHRARGPRCCRSGRDRPAAPRAYRARRRESPGRPRRRRTAGARAPTIIQRQ